MQETQVRSLGQEDPLEKEWLPSPVFLPEESHGQRSLVAWHAPVRGVARSQTQSSNCRTTTKNRVVRLRVNTQIQ